MAFPIRHFAPIVVLTLASLCSACGREEPAPRPDAPSEESTQEQPQPPEKPVEAESPAEASPPQGEQTQEAKRSIEDYPWPVRPGLRVAMVRSKVPTIDRVVLVPDEATYVEAISEWSLLGRWPVLFEDDQYAPMFIRRFKPAEVVRKAPTRHPLPQPAALQEQMRVIVSRAWSTGSEADEPTAENMKDRFAAVQWTPPGVVITSVKDDAWPAALALAADRGQPIAFLDERFGRANQVVSADDWPRLSAAVESCVASAGYPYDALGDAIDTITLARQLGNRYADASDASGRSHIAVTDGLARTGLKRWAVAGWIFGPTARTTYMAMSSIFLEHDAALLFDTYGGGSPWSRYAMDQPAARLREAGLDVREISSPASTAAAWERLAPSGLSADLILVNTSGNQNWFNTADETRVFMHDMPILNTPAAVHFVHSWSALAPENRNTLAGRWLERGAYAYVGSVEEPTLSAFVPPELLVDRLRSAVPFLVAARVWEQAPWRVTTIGDPLMILLPDLPRRAPDARPIEGANLRDVLREATDAATAGGDWTPVLRTLNLLGLDEVAMSLYEQRLKDAASADTIALALGVVFRKGDAPTLLHAFEQIPLSQVMPEQQDLLWLKWIPSLASIDQGADLMLLRRHIRTPKGYVDAGRLAPVMEALGQRDQINAMLDEFEAEAKEPYARDLVRRARP